MSAIRLAVTLLILAAGTFVSAAKIQLIEGRPVVDGVYVNGHGPYRFLVDTAATLNHIEPGLARSIGLKATHRTELISSAGTIVANASEDAHIMVDEAEATGQTFLLAGMDVVHQLHSGIRGILGQAYLSHFDYLLDLRARRLTFGKQKLSGIQSSTRMTNGRTTISTNLGELVLDSGADHLVLFGIASEAGPTNYLRTISGARFVGTAIRRLLIEGRNIWHGEVVAIPNAAEPGVAGLLPVSLFRTLYVSNSESYVVFSQ